MKRKMNCPECGQNFAHGWCGIDAHWKAKHEHVLPYSEARIVHGFAPEARRLEGINHDHLHKENLLGVPS